MTRVGFIVLSIFLNARADLPSPNLSAKDFSKLVQTTALDFSDNPNPDTTAAFRRAIEEAQKAGALKNLPSAARLTNKDFDALRKVIRVAATCEIRVEKGLQIINPRISKLEDATDEVLQKMANDCGGKGRAVREPLNPPGPPTYFTPAGR